jgi:ABC-2 type transport system permease protein
MAVHERHYRPYAGSLTPAWSRFTVLPRYALKGIFASRFYLGAFLASFVWPLGCAVVVYLHYNASALVVLELPIDKLVKIDGGFFWAMLTVQSYFAFLQVFLVGPGLVSADYRNNALPLYLARPFSRTEYVIGKLSILAFLLGLVTAVPTLLVYAFQAYLGGSAWRQEWGWIGGSLLAGSLAVVSVLSLLTLAISATVKWRPVATAALVSLAFVPAAFGAAVNGLFKTWYGDLLNLGQVFKTVFAQLFGRPQDVDMPVASAWLTLATFSVIALWLLWRKVRAYEVVR